MDFFVDDMLDTQIAAAAYDFVFDRGCFHVIDPALRSVYIENISGIIKPGGTLFLKCISRKDINVVTGSFPYKFSIDDIRGLFERYFKVESFTETVFHGNHLPLPEALFVVLKKK